MSVKLYMDVHIPRAITFALRMRKVNILTPQQDCRDTFSEADLSDRAAQLNRILFTFDDDLLIEATKSREGDPYGSVFVVKSFPRRKWNAEN